MTGLEIAAQGKQGLTGLASKIATMNDCCSLNTLIDVKLSVGLPLDKALVYGFAGVSSTVDSSTDPDSDYTGSAAAGANYGRGHDFRIAPDGATAAVLTQALPAGSAHHCLSIIAGLSPHQIAEVAEFAANRGVPVAQVSFCLLCRAKSGATVHESDPRRDCGRGQLSLPAP